MLTKIPLLLLVGLGTCLAREHEHAESHQPAHYSFAYNVQDHKTKDLKNHHEEREGDQTRGEYSLVEPDGTKRVVKYEVNGKSGFNAVVTREGHNIKETYYYGGKSGSSFEHKGNLVHDDGHSHGSGGHSSLSYNRHDLKSGSESGHHSASNYDHDSSHNQHEGSSPMSSHMTNHGASGNHGGSFSYFSKHSESSHNNHPQGKLVVVHKTPIIAVHGGSNHHHGSHVVHYGQPNHGQVMHHAHQQNIVHHGQSQHGSPQIVHQIVHHGQHNQEQQQHGPQIVHQIVHHGQQNHVQMQHGPQVVHQIVHHGQQNHEQMQHGPQMIHHIVNHHAEAQMHGSPQVHQIVNENAGHAYYNLNHQNNQKINQGAHHNENSHMAYNENFHHPNRHDYRGDFGHRTYSQAAYEQNRQKNYNSQKGNAQPGLQQFYYDRQGEEQQRAQEVQNNRHQGYNPQMHLANQIHSYNQQQMSKLYGVKPMMEEMNRSNGIVLYYGKENKFSNELGHAAKHQMPFGSYVQFHNNHGQNMNHHYGHNYAQNNMNQYHNQMSHHNQGQQMSNNHLQQGSALYSNQHGGDGYATSYQHFSVKGAKVFLSTKHIVPPKHHDIHSH